MKTSVVLCLQGLAIIFLGFSVFNIQKAEKIFMQIEQSQNDSLVGLQTQITDLKNAKAKEICERHGGEYYVPIKHWYNLYYDDIPEEKNQCFIGRDKTYYQQDDGTFLSTETEQSYLK